MDIKKTASKDMSTVLAKKIKIGGDDLSTDVVETVLFWVSVSIFVVASIQFASYVVSGISLLNSLFVVAPKVVGGLLIYFFVRLIRKDKEDRRSRKLTKQ